MANACCQTLRLCPAAHALAQVMKPNLGLLNYEVAKPIMGKPVSPNLDLLNYGAQALKKPNYMAKMFQPDMEVRPCSFIAGTGLGWDTEQ